MGMKNSSDRFKEADDVADGMIPVSQIVVHMTNSTLSDYSRATSRRPEDFSIGSLLVPLINNSSQFSGCKMPFRPHVR